ncbi:transmembrane protein, putative [Actinidia rufa]|uniref:Transmembrane protein, putative n=1 Tax=Actinidia rufa TaxID=165716 RepID=A0A7J0GIW6_9ERIC|nr:transmembrane protein, putative [Actinidia rufa]
MDRILAWVKRQWDMWDIRMLVLLSLTLQIILFMFGNRRKYISSLWISIVVWSSYLMADWVATIALGKLSHAQVEQVSNNSNPNKALQTIWAPLLLLHLGGPDTITAYSLEDNQLWMRHFMGLGVQAFVAVYVIVMSWTNSWFSFMSIPAFVGGIIKYGERTWVLKSVTDDKSGEIVPLGDVGELSVGYVTTEDKYVSALIMAHKLAKEFKRYVEKYDTSRFNFWSDSFMDESYDAYFWDATEVEMGLIYDLLYTKTSITYTMVGYILRSISFTCTVSVLVGFFCLLFRGGKYWHEQHYSMVDIAITGVLLAGALALEIYAVTLLLSSDWTLLWLIKHKGREWVIQLAKKFPQFFPMLRKKKWSTMMGQFNLLGFCLKQGKPTKFSRILSLVGMQDKFNMYMHKTSVAVPTDLHSTILNYIFYLSESDTATISGAQTEGFTEDDSTAKRIRFYSEPFDEQIFILHMATEMCYNHDLSESNTSPNSTHSSEDYKEIRETCKILSHYMMYLLLMRPLLLPVAVPDAQLRERIESFKSILGSSVGDVTVHWQKLEKIPPLDLLFGHLKEKQESERWGILKSMWLRMLCYAAITGSKTNNHLQQLRQGGELLTLLMFFIPQSDILPGVNLFGITRKLNKQGSDG